MLVDYDLSCSSNLSESFDESYSLVFYQFFCNLSGPYEIKPIRLLSLCCGFSFNAAVTKWI